MNAWLSSLERNKLNKHKAQFGIKKERLPLHSQACLLRRPWWMDSNPVLWVFGSFSWSSLHFFELVQSIIFSKEKSNREVLKCFWQLAFLKKKSNKMKFLLVSENKPCCRTTFGSFNFSTTLAEFFVPPLPCYQLGLGVCSIKEDLLPVRLPNSWRRTLSTMLTSAARQWV